MADWPPVAAGPRESFCTKGRATGNHAPRFVMFAERRPGSEIHVTTRGIEVKHPDHAVFVHGERRTPEFLHVREETRSRSARLHGLRSMDFARTQESCASLAVERTA